MEKAANHLLSLINDVLQMSKLEDGREELSSELVCLPDVFYDMKAIMDGSALDKGISVDFSEDSIWVHPYVITNPLYLRQIFLNRLHKKELMPGAIIMEPDLEWLLLRTWLRQWEVPLMWRVNWDREAVLRFS